MTSPSDLIAEFFVGGLVRPQPRAQPGRGGHVIMATAAHGIREWRSYIHAEGQRAMNGRPPYTGAIRAEAVFRFPRPETLLKRRGWDPTAKTTKPDLKNILTALEDALNMVVWADDCQITTWVIRKRYVLEHEPPGVMVRVLRETYGQEKRNPRCRDAAGAG